MLKLQESNTLDCMVLHAFGSIEERRQDWFLYHCSGIESIQQQILLIDGAQYEVYGNSRYTWNTFIEVPFQRSNLYNNQKTFNTSMAELCVTVDWIFKEVQMYFPVVDTKRR